MVVISYHLKWAAITNRYEYDFVYELSDELLNCVMPFEILVVKGFRLKMKTNIPNKNTFHKEKDTFFKRRLDTPIRFGV